jgi:glycosyltransferase involved in cell wall biosynthesis
MVDFYQQRYPNLHCTALVHSFNEKLPGFVSPPAPGSPLRGIISGNINATCSDAAGRVAQALQQIPDAHLTILSGTTRAELERQGLLRERVELDTVSRDVLIERLTQSDIVFLPHGFQGGLSDAEYQTIFPTKTIEYLICGRPILAHTPANCFLTRFLKQWDCALIVEEPTVDAVVAAIGRLRGDKTLRDRLVGNALKAAEQFQAEHVAAHLRKMLFA